MISSQLLQKTIDEIKGISGLDMALLDLDGDTVARTSGMPRFNTREVLVFTQNFKDGDKMGNFRFYSIKDESAIDYYLIIMAAENSEIVGPMVRYQIETLLVAYKERFDKDNFYKSLLLDNLLLIDIYSRAKKLHIDMEAPRSVIIAELKGHSRDETVAAVKSLYAGSGDDFVTALEKKSIIIVKHVDSLRDYDSMNDACNKLQEVIVRESGEEAEISYGSIVPSLKEVSKSYKEAKMAMDVGRIFFAERNINSYSSLGIGRLIYHLPIPLCKLFLVEIFGDMRVDDFDEETITTINKFFENSLNVSETSRQLYIHRNTLVYRLDKIQKITNLDLREFSDAITFRIALMVSKYMKYVEGLERK